MLLYQLIVVAHLLFDRLCELCLPVLPTTQHPSHLPASLPPCPLNPPLPITPAFSIVLTPPGPPQP